MYQSRRAGDEAKKRKSPAKSGRVGITAYVLPNYCIVAICYSVSVLACTVMGYEEGEVSHFFNALSNNKYMYTDMLPWKLRVTELWCGGF